MPYKDRQKQLDAQRTHYERNKITYIDRSNDRRRALRVWLDDYLSDKRCKRCGESDRACLDFVHRDLDNKRDTVSQLIAQIRSRDDILHEISKCDLLCSNCHRKQRAGR